MIKILTIGNSFSQDSTAMLHDLVAAAGVDTKVVNLYIGGCSLQQHWENAAHNAAGYVYELNGKGTQRMVSIREALEEENWDFITLQQASHDSGMPETYSPYLQEMAAYVRCHVPNCRLHMLETWAYETDSDHGAFERYGRDQAVMTRRLIDAYHWAAREIQAHLIPCGEVIQALRALPAFDYPHGGISLCRDGYHMNLIYGRYATAATLAMCLVGGDIRLNPYLPADEEGGTAEAALIDQIKQTVYAVVTAQP